MSKLIGLFPGQGAQFVGMAKQIAEDFAPAKEMLIKADQILEFPISKMMFEGPEEDLKFTANTQPALFISSMMVMELLKSEGVKLDMVAGHSLGEYSAICAAGGLSFEDGLKLVRVRGKLMGSAGEKQPGAMSAVIGMSEEELITVVQEVSTEEAVVVAANFNCPGQIVISGSIEGVKKAGEVLTELEKRVIPLPVSGAFHSPLMNFAVEGLRESIEKTQFNDLECPLIANVTAKEVTKASEIKELLVQQLFSPVRWQQSMENAIAVGLTEGIEIGSGKVLMGLMRKIDRNIKVNTISNKAELDKYLGK